MARVGVFVCHCGSNIAGTVDCAAVASAARAMPGVVHASDYKYMCSEPGQKLIQDKVAAERLDRVVVASCSPRMHEPTFRRTVAAAGVNPYRMEMANLREHCSWVHGTSRWRRPRPWRSWACSWPRPCATRPSSPGVRAHEAAARDRRRHRRHPGRLDVANAGYEVTLVERTPTIGGKMAMLDKTFRPSTARPAS